VKSIRVWCLRVAGLFAGARRDEELAAELESHLQLHSAADPRARVRVALGATATEIVRLVMGQGIRLALVGAGLGLAAALATTRALVGLVNGIEPNDPLTFAAGSAVLIGAALLATYLPARRAARVDPIAALRSE
jgi:predicted lysophospholipase L1 biosynthesis ABC-type transport system permease subunit